LSALLAILSTLWRRPLRLNLRATLATTSPATGILRPGLDFVVAVPFMFAALRIVLVF